MGRAPGNKPDTATARRAQLVDAVTTPLGFFVLAVLVVEAVIGLLAAFVPASERGSIMIYMIGILALLVVVVAGLACFRIDALMGKRINSDRTYSVVISAPTSLADLDIERIAWDREKCYLCYGNRKEKINPVFGAVGLGLEVRISSPVLDAISHTEPVDLQFVDRLGFRWEVAPFYIYQRTVRLRCLSKEREVILAYGDKDD
jgi:hypothetical protein